MASSPVMYFDGVFDVLHAGHANALRQARSLAGTLVVGVVSDSDALHAKGSAPLWSENERSDAVRALKFADCVLTGMPYELHGSLLDWLASHHNVDAVAHGDDPCTLPDGRDAYASAHARNMLTLVRRTEGISTTDIVGRAILPSQERSRAHQLALTSRRLCAFSSARALEPLSDTVVYVPGVFDAFTPGHARALDAAHAHGSYVIAGILSDSDAARLRSAEPLCSMHERALSVLACRHVDDILLAGPDVPSDKDVASLSISVVLALPDDGITETSLKRLPVPVRCGSTISVLRHILSL
jgi:ethanolamine-phosphate cytidylyltransferase